MWRRAKSSRSHGPCGSSCSSTVCLERRSIFISRAGSCASRSRDMARAVTIYGIKNCDTMKKARAFIDKRGVSYIFHDYKTEGVERAQLEIWAKAVGWET